MGLNCNEKVVVFQPGHKVTRCAWLPPQPAEDRLEQCMDGRGELGGKVRGSAARAEREEAALEVKKVKD